MNSDNDSQRKTRSKTELESQSLSEYLVRKNSVELDNSNWNESTISKRVSLWIKWYGKFASHKLSLILKSPVIMRMLLILTSIFLRYFKANWDKSKYTLIKKKIDSWLKKKIQETSL